MIPGANLLKIALAAQGIQFAMWHRATGRQLNAVGQWVTEYANPKLVSGSIQATPKSKYAANGLDYQSNHITCFFDLNIGVIQRGESGDQLTYAGRRWQFVGNTDWRPQDGWQELFAVDIGPDDTPMSCDHDAGGNEESASSGGQQSSSNASQGGSTTSLIGPIGPQGESGAAATINIGAVTTLPAGSAATVINSGTENAAVFDFAIPLGQPGTNGVDGSNGIDGAAGQDGQAATVSVGTVSTGAPGSSATVTNVGSSSAAVFNFSIPRGDTGATGSTGAAGTAATVAVGSVTTGAAGSSATVTNSGTSSAAVFDITIPRGDTGATGATGATGPAGTSVVAYSVTGTIDFGSTESGDASVSIAATWAGSYPYCVTVTGHPSDHDPEDMAIEQLHFSPYVDAGVGFVVHAHAPLGTWGRYNVNIIGFQ